MKPRHRLLSLVLWLLPSIAAAAEPAPHAAGSTPNALSSADPAAVSISPTPGAPSPALDSGALAALTETPAAPSPLADAKSPTALPAEATAHDATADLTSLPVHAGLPIVVRAGVYFLQVSEIDDNEGAFAATVDSRLRWRDARLSYPASEAPRGFKEFRGAAADAKLGEIWQPQVHLSNLKGEPDQVTKGVRIFPDGNVELVARTTGTFETEFDVENFPFDRQALIVEVGVEEYTLDAVTLDFRQSELDFSKLAPGVDVDGWELGLVGIRRTADPGWYGQSYAKLEVALDAKRQPGGSAAAIFIPLLASLLIPLLSIWLNKVNDGEFQVEAFELTNIIIGGLFAVIALNFTVNAEYQMLSGQNTVSRLFLLNYVTLGVSLLVNLLLFRFNIVTRLAGKYAQEQTYAFLVWGIPVVVSIISGAVLLNAMV